MKYYTSSDLPEDLRKLHQFYVDNGFSFKEYYEPIPNWHGPIVPPELFCKLNNVTDPDVARSIRQAALVIEAMRNEAQGIW